jgi:hypothetical protein
VDLKMAHMDNPRFDPLFFQFRRHNGDALIYGPMLMGTAV